MGISNLDDEFEGKKIWDLLEREKSQINRIEEDKMLISLMRKEIEKLKDRNAKLELVCVDAINRLSYAKEVSDIVNRDTLFENYTKTKNELARIYKKVVDVL